MSLAAFTGLPMVMCMISDLLGGMASDYAARRFGLRAGRGIVAGSSFLFAAIFIAIGTAATDPTQAAVLLAIAAGWSTFCLGAAWSTCVDIAGWHAGVISACMNTAGQVGGFLSPIILAYIIHITGDWSIPLYVTGALFLVGALCWCFIDPARPVEAQVMASAQR